MLDYKSVELDKIIYKTPTKIDGKYIGKILYNNDDIIIKIPYLHSIGSIVINENRCYLELELDVDDKDLYDFFADLDDMSMNSAYQRSKKWFGDQMPLDIIDEYYRRFIRYNSRLQKPYIKVKVPISDKNIDVDDFKKDVLMSCVIRCDGLRFYKQQFMSEWSLIDYEIENDYEFKENILNSSDNDLDDIIDTVINENNNRNYKDDEGNDDESNNGSNNDESNDNENNENSDNDISDTNDNNIEDYTENKNEDEEEKDNKKKENDKRSEEMMDVFKDVFKDGIRGVGRRRKPRIIKFAHRNRIWE